MDVFDEKIDEQLARYLAGETSDQETAEVERWAADAPAHRKYLEDLRWLWQHSTDALPAAPRAVDPERALLQVKKRLHGGTGPALRWQRGLWMRVAAALLFVVAAVYWWQQRVPNAPARIATTAVARTETLADGSTITLGQHSGLTLAPGFNRRERRVRLEGEAFFKVAPDTTRPFLVQVAELEVRVVGTAFTVDNASDTARVTVRVTEGKVLVRSRHGQALFLTPGEGAVYQRQTGELTRIGGPDQRPDRMLRFDATPLDSVLAQINAAYGTSVVLKNRQLGRCLLTARYNNLALPRLIELIAESFNLRVEKKDDTYWLDGEGCGE